MRDAKVFGQGDSVTVYPMASQRATCNPAVRTCEIIRDAGIPRIIFLALIAAPQGIACLQHSMPEVSIHVAAIDQGLNDIGFIVPGLGDAGDRQFSTIVPTDG